MPTHDARPSSVAAAATDCDADPIEALKAMFVDQFQGGNIARGEDPASRPVFRRLHGAAHGTFRVVEGLPEELRVGVFGQRASYPAWVRFSSDVQPGAPDYKGTCGVGIKLFGVEGEKGLEPETAAPTQDFLLQNIDVFFADTAAEMCAFTKASLSGEGREYLARHPRMARILQQMKKEVPSVVESPYWSGIPFRFGDARFVKYKLEPEAAPPPAGPPDYDDPFYLRADLHDRLRRGEVRFRFLVQFQTDPEAMPLDRATVPWSEADSPPVHVATLVLPAQDVGGRGQDAYGEALAYNVGRALAAHAPVGSIAEARVAAYRASAAQRRDVNGQPAGEPATPRPATWRDGEPYPAPADREVVRAEIHPAVGVMRLGNSDEHYLGPEVTPLAPTPAGAMRDDAGRLKRQAVRFRVYGYNAAGEVVRELTDDWADVSWTVHVANRKAAWYDWAIALDIPEAEGTVTARRNKDVRGADREALVVDAGPVTISGGGTAGERYALAGAFLGVDVALGRLETDDDGRLVVIPAAGVSATPTGAPIFPTEAKGDHAFINADGWYDDACDGPVTARVRIGGREVPCEPAWVLSAPPNYAPDVVSVRTLYDLLLDVFGAAGWVGPPPAEVSFRDDVYPVLRRFSALGWVNRGFAEAYGPGRAFPFEDPDFVGQLRARSAAGALLRREVFRQFRDPADPSPALEPWPWIYGDAMATKPPYTSPRQNATVSERQYLVLERWAAGAFVDDWDGPPPPTELADVPLADRPATLTRAALDDALADAFHPGCEVTWPIRHLSMWRSPFRLRHRPAGAPAPDYGDVLTPAIALRPFGPLYEQGPGDLTRWMGLPWQADTAYCRAGYDREYSPYVPSFWPATVPNQVFTREAYDAFMEAETPEDRAAAFARRASWVRFLTKNGTGTSTQMETMVRMYWKMGALEQHDGPGDPAYPPVVLVESLGPDPGEPDPDLADPTTDEAAPTAEAYAATAKAAVPAKVGASVKADVPAKVGAGRPAADLPEDASFASPEEAASAPTPVQRP